MNKSIFQKENYSFLLFLLFIILFIVWIPFSFIFDSHPHFPFAQTAPIIGVFMIVMLINDKQSPLESWYFDMVTLPTIVFWGLYVILAIVIKILIRRKANKF